MLSQAIMITVIVLALARFWLLPIGGPHLKRFLTVMIAVLLWSASTIAGARESPHGSPVGIERPPLARTGPIRNTQYIQGRAQEFKTPDGPVNSAPSAEQAVDALYREIMRQTAPQSVAPQ